MRKSRVIRCLGAYRGQKAVSGDSISGAMQAFRAIRLLSEFPRSGLANNRAKGLLGFVRLNGAVVVEVVMVRGVDGGKFLKGLNGPEPCHRPLSSTERLV